MYSVYLSLTSKINEKVNATSANINAVRQEIKFIAEQISQDQSVDAQIDSAF